MLQFRLSPQKTLDSLYFRILVAGYPVPDQPEFLIRHFFWFDFDTYMDSQLSKPGSEKPKRRTYPAQLTLLAWTVSSFKLGESYCHYLTYIDVTYIRPGPGLNECSILHQQKKVSMTNHQSQTVTESTVEINFRLIKVTARNVQCAALVPVAVL